MNKISVVAFDCDGVLFDSAEANRAYYNQILRHFDLPDMTDAQFAHAHMHTVDEALSNLIQDPILLDQVNSFRSGQSYVPFIRFMRMEPDLRSLLERLRPVFKTAIATNRTDTMMRVLQDHGLEGDFDKVVTAADVRYPKPHPDLLLQLLDYFRITADRMIYIGDSQVDEVAAHEALVPFVAYGNPRLNADYHIDHLGQLDDLLLG
ncbi:MAG: HAD family hydrolase [Desulfatitalea sp.]|nr:HAD family hydrolase [Desulfatitalea sp.]NNJ99149.1 HAD family hydrolase [Desulfatitalea sp.]